MTAKRRLVPDHEVRWLLNLAQEYGIEIGGLDVRGDGVTILPVSQVVTPNPATQDIETEYANWKTKNPIYGKGSHRNKAAK